MGENTSRAMSKRERKAPQSLTYDAPEPAAKKAKSKKAAPAAKKAKKEKKGYKGACGPYMFFVNENRDQVKADNPDLSFGELGKELGEMWRNLSAKDKQPFEKMAAKDKIRAAKDKAAWEKANK